jgi:hypothetical protein
VDGTVFAACHDHGSVVVIDPSCGHAGGFAVTMGQCVPCALGEAKPAGLNGTWCTPCAPGSISARPQSVACEPVPAGSYDPGFIPRVVAVPCAPVSALWPLLCSRHV